ncbi:ABC transporter substrate-binding protein [Bradyrhizobium sp. Arg237L]|uniref:ABC transporter substrate-binding protein n=1 Tax=Bradyrhizobium sp. Arg237L TaxID=3003352 RepID=UPI00249EF662|nr:ABC transporter substrate-binding protein [Bradyrhizobium sp. Arg237L]MDI4237142.1 ABC transporter substrate-binding protein [Bradyrhizobium sp. Arg237L]
MLIELEVVMKRTFAQSIMSAAALACMTGALPSFAAAQEQVKIGFVFFLSGPGAAYGSHARDGTKLIVEALNAGKVPAPYDKPGINGLPIQAVFVDEAGGAQKQLAEYRRLVEREQVDMVIGYNSSGDCNAIAPVAEELRVLTDFFHCGNPQLFEDIVTEPLYSVRTAPTGTMDQVAAAKYLLEKMPGIKTVSGINQDYSWGQDSWTEFKAAMSALKPDIQYPAASFTKLGTSDYGAEISTLLGTPSEALFSSFWGGDADAFALQASTRGLDQKSKFVLTMGTGIIDDLGEKAIVGSIFGARGPHGYFARKTPLSAWFKAEYGKTYNRMPPFGAYAAAQGIFGIKAAYEKAAAGAAGKQKTEAVIAALKGLTFDTASGFPATMANNDGHQAIQATAYGVYSGWDKARNEAIITEVKVYPAECVNPPNGVRAVDWIKSGFKGAKC